MSKSRLIWKGDQTLEEVTTCLTSGLVEVDLRIEAEAKKELYPGHGKITGTLQRSIHADEPTHNWTSDNGADQERGGRDFQPLIEGNKLVSAVGSGLVYAMAVHQGHHDFAGYHYITNALSKVNPEVPGIFKRHAKRKG